MNFPFACAVSRSGCRRYEGVYQSLIKTTEVDCTGNFRVAAIFRGEKIAPTYRWWKARGNKNIYSRYPFGYTVTKSGVDLRENDFLMICGGAPGTKVEREDWKKIQGTRKGAMPRVRLHFMYGGKVQSSWARSILYRCGTDNLPHLVGTVPHLRKFHSSFRCSSDLHDVTLYKVSTGTEK